MHTDVDPGHFERVIPWPGRHYHLRYGCPVRWAIPAEIAWRIEHVGPYRGGDGGLCGRIRRRGYRWRKVLERAGCPA